MGPREVSEEPEVGGGMGRGRWSDVLRSACGADDAAGHVRGGDIVATL
jgi:hypothetical protein